MIDATKREAIKNLVTDLFIYYNEPLFDRRIELFVSDLEEANLDDLRQAADEWRVGKKEFRGINSGINTIPLPVDLLQTIATKDF